MKKWQKILLYPAALFFALFIFIALQYLLTGSPDKVSPVRTDCVGAADSDGVSDSAVEIVAHRGVHHNYQKGVYHPVTGCEALHIFPPTHELIENTVDSIAAAFAAGATMVEIDIRRTADDNMVLMHDYMLECRTDGTGLVGEHDTAYLQGLDIGYGYTADGGKTFPLRGKGVGKMPTLAEVLHRFPDGCFLLDHKDWNVESAETLVKILADVPGAQRRRLWFWGPEEPLRYIQGFYPEIRRFFPLRAQLKEFGLPFFLSFGLIKVPEEYRGLSIPIPARYLKWVWGWPYRFIDTAHNQGLKVMIYVDTAEEAARYKELPVDGFVTDYIEITGPILQD